MRVVPVLLLVLRSRLALAFSSGAGRCIVGEPAVQGSHLSADSVTTGSLFDGGYSATVGGVPVVAGGDPIILNVVGEPMNIQISGPEFRGVLIMVGGQDDSTITPGDGLKLNTDGTNCAGTASVTHIDSSLKTSASATITFPGAALTTIALNIVVQNSGGVSTYYYSSVDFEARVVETLAPTPPDPATTLAPTPATVTTDAPVAAAPTTPPPPTPPTTPAPPTGNCPPGVQPVYLPPCSPDGPSPPTPTAPSGTPAPVAAGECPTTGLRPVFC